MLENAIWLALMYTPSHDAVATGNANGPLNILIERIDGILPQTQCQQCGYHGCRPYAEAIAQGQAPINQCPPGGESGIQALAGLLNLPYLPLNPAHGMTKPAAIAVIDEPHCIGCTLCIKACPVDAILGASRQMHTVISQECTGCELCLPPCPVDCIVMRPVATTLSTQVQAEDSYRSKTSADVARKRYQHRQARLRLEKQQTAQTYAEQHQPMPVAVRNAPDVAMHTSGTEAIKKAAIAAAMARAKAQKSAR